MNEKYEIIIKENGEEIKRVSTKVFLLTAMYEDGIYNTVMVDCGVSNLEIALLTNDNEKLLDNMCAEIGVTSREKREIICRLVREAKMAVEEGDEE